MKLNQEPDVNRNRKTFWHKSKLAMRMVLILAFSSPFVFAYATIEVEIRDDYPRDGAVQQGFDVSGVVRNDGGAPLPGATIIEKGTTNGTQSDADGNFALRVSDPNAVLEASFIGYAGLEVPVQGRARLDIVLQEEASTLDEVIVVGYGEQRKAHLTGAFTQIDSDIIEGRPITSASQVLQGVTPGVFLTQVSGQAGADHTRIRVRGVSLQLDGAGSNEPLILVDGVEASFNDINPSDIKTVTVLKDAAASAIYGSRAANGVVVITTERGKEAKTVFEYDFLTGLQQATSLPDVISNSVQYMELFNEAMTNRGAAPVFSQARIDAYRNDPTLPNQNWYDLVYRTAPMQQHNFKLHGGNEDLRFYFSGGYLDQEGIEINNRTERYNMRLNLDAKVSSRLRFGVNLAGSNQQSHRGTSAGFDDLTATFLQTMSSNPTTTHVVSGDGRYVRPNTGFGSLSNRNPVADSENGQYDRKMMQFNGAVFGELMILDGLTLKGQASYRHQERRDKFFTRGYEQFENATGGIWNSEVPEVTASVSIENGGRNTLSKSTLATQQYTMFATLNYQKTFGQHDVSALIGAQDEWVTGDGFSAQIIHGFPDPIREFPGGSSDLADQSVSRGGGFVPAEWMIRSYFSRVSYTFKERYLLETNMRVDNSSRFHPDNRTGYFPSVSAGWRISEEPFLKGVAAISSLKLRVSWGRLGEQRGNDAYAYISSISNTDGYIFSDGSGETTGKSLNALKTAETTWQTNEMYNAGMDLSVLDGRLNVVADYFVKNNLDQLAQVPLVNFAGLAAPLGNPFSMQNRGWEFAINFRNKGTHLNYHAGLNVTHVTNEVTDLKGQEIKDTNTITREGLPLRTLYIYKWDGIIQTQDELNALNAGSPTGTYQLGTTGVGDLKYADINGDGMITADDRVPYGNPYPDFSYGITLGLNYKGIDFSALLQGVLGYDIFGDSWGLNALQQGSLTSFWLDRWTPENPSTTKPRLLDGRAGYINNRPDNFPSTFYTFSGNYLRFKNLQLGYTLPKSLTTRAGINKLRIYMNAQNAFTISNFLEGFDPERLTITDPSSASTRVGVYPQTKIFSLGVNVGL